MSSSSSSGSRTRRLSRTPTQLEGGLRGGRAVVADPHDAVDRGQQAVVDLLRPLEVTGVHRLDHREVLVAAHVPDHRDQADATVRQPGQVGRVVTGVDGEAEVADQADSLGKVAHGLLDRDHVVDRGGPLVGLPADPDTGATRHVVEQHGEVGRAGHRLEVGEDPALRRLGVVRRHDHHAGRTELGGLLGQLQRVRRAVGADAGHDRDPVTDGLDDGAEQLAVLGDRRGRRLARRAGDHDARRARGRRGGWRPPARRRGPVIRRPRTASPSRPAPGRRGREEDSCRSGYRFRPGILLAWVWATWSGAAGTP